MTVDVLKSDLKTPSAGEEVRRMAKQVTWCEPMKLDDEGFVPLDLVERAAKIVDLSGAVTQLEDWIAADCAGVKKHAGGRPPYVSIRAALILIVLVGMLDKPLYVTNAAEIVRFRLHGKAWQVVGLDMTEYKNRHATQWYDRIWHTIRHKVRKPLDPYPETAIYKRLTQEAYEAIENSRDPDYVRARKLRGSIFSSLLAFASARQMGDKYFVDGTYEGDIVVDATPIETLTYGNWEGDLRPSNADAGYYIRTGDHNRGDSPTVRKKLWGYDLTVVEATGGYFTGDMPKPIIGLSLDNPGVQPGYNARAALAVYENAVFAADDGEDLMLPRGLAIGDMAYSPGSDAQSYQIPMWLAGWSVMGQTPKRPEARGVSLSYEGMVLIDGKPYSPAITVFPTYSIRSLIWTQNSFQSTTLTSVFNVEKHLSFRFTRCVKTGLFVSHVRRFAELSSARNARLTSKRERLRPRIRLLERHLCR